MTAMLFFHGSCTILIPPTSSSDAFIFPSSPALLSTSPFPFTKRFSVRSGRQYALGNVTISSKNRRARPSRPICTVNFLSWQLFPSSSSFLSSFPFSRSASKLGPNVPLASSSDSSELGNGGIVRAASSSDGEKESGIVASVETKGEGEGKMDSIGGEEEFATSQVFSATSGGNDSLNLKASEFDFGLKNLAVESGEEEEGMKGAGEGKQLELEKVGVSQIREGKIRVGEKTEVKISSVPRFSIPDASAVSEGEFYIFTEEELRNAGEEKRDDEGEGGEEEGKAKKLKKKSILARASTLLISPADDTSGEIQKAEEDVEGFESDSDGSDSSSPVEVLRELLRSANDALENARRRSAEFEELAQRTAERAIALKDEAMAAEAEADDAMLRVEEVLSEELLEMETLERDEASEKAARKRVEDLERQIEASSMRVSTLEPLNDESNISLTSVESDEVKKKRAALEEARSQLEEAASCVTETRRILAACRERKADLQAYAIRLCEIAQSKKETMLLSEEEVSDAMGVAEKAVAIELEAISRVREAEILLRRAEETSRDIRAEEAKAVSFVRERKEKLKKELKEVAASLVEIALEHAASDSDSDEDREKETGGEEREEKKEGGQELGSSEVEKEKEVGVEILSEVQGESAVSEALPPLESPEISQVLSTELTQSLADPSPSSLPLIQEEKREEEEILSDEDQTSSPTSSLSPSPPPLPSSSLLELQIASLEAALEKSGDREREEEKADAMKERERAKAEVREKERERERGRTEKEKKGKSKATAPPVASAPRKKGEKGKQRESKVPDILFLSLELVNNNLPKVGAMLTALLLGGLVMRLRADSKRASLPLSLPVPAAHSDTLATSPSLPSSTSSTSGLRRGLREVQLSVQKAIDKLPRHEPNEEETQLYDVLWLLLASVIFVPAFQKLPGGSPVLGYLVAGVLIGPYALSIIKHVEGTKALAEFGVVFLMFNIGLELSWERLRSMRKYVFGLGSAQVLVTAGIVGAFVHFFCSFSGPAALVVGNALALSSTAVVLQVLQERGESTSRHGRATFSVLLLQDIAVVVLLILIPLISPSSSKGGVGFLAIAEALGLAAVKAVVAISGIIAGGRLLLRPIYKSMAENHNSEIFAANTLLVVLATSVMTARAGLSMALGAFLAGLLLAETEFALQVESDITPYRGLLLGLFFMTVGMSIDPRLLVAQFPSLILSLFLLIVGKTLLLALVGKFFGLSPIAAVRSGLLLAPGGEFAFVAFREAVHLNILPPSQSSFLFLLVGLSMAITPYLAAIGGILASRFEQQDIRSLQPVEAETDDLQGHIIICGFGRVGQIIAQLLSERLIPFVALDVRSERVSAGRSLDIPVFFGDAGSRDVLHKVGAERAAAAVITLDSPGANYRTVWCLTKNFPNVKTFVRAHDVDHGINLEKAGATAVVPETLEPSLQLAAAVLAQVKLPPAEIASTLDDFRTRHLAELTELSTMSGSSLGYGFSMRLQATKESIISASASSPASVTSTSSSSSSSSHSSPSSSSVASSQQGNGSAAVPLSPTPGVGREGRKDGTGEVNDLD